MRRWAGWASVAVLAAGLAAPAGAGVGGTSVSAFGAFWKPRNYDSQYGGGAKLRLAMLPLLHFEGRASYFPDLKLEHASLDVAPLEANVQFQVPLGRFLPYAGVGLGYYVLDAKRKWNNDTTTADNQWGGFVVAGLELGLTENWALYGEAKWTKVNAELKWNDVDFTNQLDGLGVNAGVAYNF